ncbi:hypothetical protein L2E82_47589 [Cichorium intybus]|uniref:Uncharacterized protein n=1 Tax=Cichorium intybus TaxID=13427 RepID=A0ACB8YWM1_CICIN|nr:hypothetical protein L2E82_47589 [Cichorium intybus]
MDPDQAWYFKSYMDVGEFGLGENAMALLELNDCSRYAYYMDGVFANNDGRPFIQSNIICIFERYAGDIGWRHSEIPIMGFHVGMLMVKGIPYKNINDIPNTNDMTGPLVSENVIGVVHDHFISFHLDMDIDGANNRTATSLLDLDDPPQIQGAFTNNQINISEQWAGGLLVSQSNGEDTLATWSAGVSSHTMPRGLPDNADSFIEF